MLEDNEICCERMKLEVEQFNRKDINGNGLLKSVIWYQEDRRTFCILDNRKPDDYDGYWINFCPFCGAKLPSRLDPDDYIEREYGYDYVRYTHEPEYKALPPDVRKEFDTDLWWKKRGL